MVVSQCVRAGLVRKKTASVRTEIARTDLLLIGHVGAGGQAVLTPLAYSVVGEVSHLLTILTLLDIVVELILNEKKKWSAHTGLLLGETTWNSAQPTIGTRDACIPSLHHSRKISK